MSERAERIIVAMSGGVDSSVAAARLRDAGYDVVGVTLHLWDYPETSERGHGRCCAPEDQYDARRVADALGFPHYTFDRRDLFARTVVDPFVDAYLQGSTPSPCTACNRHVKLGELFAIADRLGARSVATGHYARVVSEGAGPARLAMGADRSKDQSYFLYASPQAWLDRLVFPLGDSMKTDVRAEAVRRALPGAGKGESQELCFVGPQAHAYTAFIEQRAGARIRPGSIVDHEGRTVGTHAGVHRFTVGQRRGVGVAVGRPAFVTRIDPEDATIHIGGEGNLLARVAHVRDLSLAKGVSLPLRARVRVRFRHAGEAATVTADGGGAAIRFDQPVRAITAGQIAVFYDEHGESVLGGGPIVGADDLPRGDALPSRA
jgi:tRNA-specific 2-thiouridylase